MEVKAGDMVTLKSVRPEGWNSCGKMDEFLGKTVKVTHVTQHTLVFEGSGRWTFRLTDIEGYGEESAIKNNYSII